MVNFQEQGQLEDLRLGERETKYRARLAVTESALVRVKVREVERRMVKVKVSWWSDSCEVRAVSSVS